MHVPKIKLDDGLNTVDAYNFHIFTPTIILDNNDNTFNAPLGETTVDALGGTDTLILDWSTVDGPIRTVAYQGWGDGIRQALTDDGLNTVDAYNFNIFRLTGGAGNDDLRGWNNADILNGGLGDDILSGGLGADLIDGGAGLRDTWSVDYSSFAATPIAVVLKAGGLTFTVAATGAKIKNIEQLSITTSSGDDIINTSAVVGNDTIVTDDGDDTVNSGRGVDHMNTGGGLDTVVMNWAAATTNITLIGDPRGIGSWWEWQFADGSGNKLILDDYRNTEQFNLTGGSGNDYLRGLNYNDVLKGGAGNDTLGGYQGIDTIDGGAGTDLYVGDFTNPEVAGGVMVDISTAPQVKAMADGSGSLGAIAGIERLDLTGTVGADIFTANSGIYDDIFSTLGGDDIVTTGRGVDTAALGGGLDTVVMNWGAAITNITFTADPRGIGYWWEWQFVNGSGDKLLFSDYRDVEQFRLTGGSGDDYLRGRSEEFDDILVGGGGNDTLYSGAGNDTVDGGVGIDTWQADQSTETAAILFNATTSQTTAQGVAAGLEIRNIEATDVNTGAGNDNLSTDGFSGNDRMSTGGGNDIVNLGRGVDTVNTGGGTDTLVMNWVAAATNITFTADPRGIGYWWEWRFANGNGDQLTLTDYRETEQFRLTGGSGDDYLRGRGEAFDDILLGGSGNDTLYSGAGNDTVNGGIGTDTWQADQSAETAAILFNATTGQTTAQGAAAGLAISKIEILNISTGAGNDNINTSGYAGNDTVNTNNGNDTVNLGGGFDVTDGGAGTDTLIMSMATATSDIRYTDIGGGWYTYADADGTARLQFTNFETANLTGGSGNDSLLGGVNNDTLIGNVGDDYLAGYGSTGGSAPGTFDVVNGGAGNDRYYGNFDGINKTLKLVLDATGGGNLVNAAVPTTQYAALDGIESVTLYTGQGGDTINLGAVTGDQNIYTRDGNDTISVGSGHHYLDGGNGTDTAVVDFSSSTTTITGLAQFGNSTLTDAAGLNSVTFSGIEVFNITGGSGNDRLFAYGSDDTLRGGGGNDILYGGGGNDVLYGGIDSDVYRYAYGGGQGVDSIMDAAGGDRIKFDGALDGAFSNIAVGNGSSTANHVIEVETKADGYTYLYFGVNATVGADITMKLFGTYATDAFQIVNSGRDLKVILGDSNPGTPGDDTLNGTSGNDTLDGGTGNDKLYGKDGDDTLIGGTGNDLLVGGMGRDTLTGGDGVDIFDYNLIAESQPGAVYSDFLTDFTPGTDKIDLLNIDANSVVGGNQAFGFIGVNAFSGEAGELRWEDSTDALIPDVLQMDVNGDGVSDMEIQLVGSTTGITAINFIL